MRRELDHEQAAGAAAILLGTLTLSIQSLMASTHTWEGVNYANAFNTSLTLVGAACVLIGIGILVAPAIRKISAQTSEVLKTSEV